MNIRQVLFAMCLLSFALPVAAEAGQWRELGTYKVTGYDACVKCCGKADGISADGTYLPGLPYASVAAPPEIPFGTRLRIEGVGVVVVHDRGGAIKGQRLELFFPSHKEALLWGVQNHRVWVWEGEASASMTPSAALTVPPQSPSRSAGHGGYFTVTFDLRPSTLLFYAAIVLAVAVGAWKISPILAGRRG